MRYNPTAPIFYIGDDDDPAPPLFSAVGLMEVEGSTSAAKTVTALHMLLGIASGKPLSGQEVARSGPVGYISSAEPRAAWRCIDAMARAFQINPLPSVRVIDARPEIVWNIERLTAIVHSIPGLVALVIDDFPVEGMTAARRHALRGFARDAEIYVVVVYSRAKKTELPPVPQPA